jgi:hypothetical protein
VLGIRFIFLQDPDLTFEKVLIRLRIRIMTYTCNRQSFFLEILLAEIQHPLKSKFIKKLSYKRFLKYTYVAFTHTKQVDIGSFFRARILIRIGPRRSDPTKKDQIRNTERMQKNKNKNTTAVKFRKAPEETSLIILRTS